MRNIFRIGMAILCAVVSFICISRNDMVFAAISAIFGILFAYRQSAIKIRKLVFRLKG